MTAAFADFTRSKRSVLAFIRCRLAPVGSAPAAGDHTHGFRHRDGPFDFGGPIPPSSKITAVSSGGDRFTAVLLSLAGIPATIGFIGKFYILASGANASAWPLILVLVLTSVIGLFYYLRIVVTLFSTAPEPQPSTQILEWGSAFVLGGLAVLLIGFGVYPAPLLNLIRATIGGLN